MHWIDVLQSFKPLSGIGIDTVSLMRHGSTVSLQSNSLTANPSLGFVGLREKIAEMETYRDILSTQLSTLQRFVNSNSNKLIGGRTTFDNNNPIFSYFDAQEYKNGTAYKTVDGLNPIDFKV